MIYVLSHKSRVEQVLLKTFNLQRTSIEIHLLDCQTGAFCIYMYLHEKMIFKKKNNKTQNIFVFNQLVSTEKWTCVSQSDKAYVELQSEGFDVAIAFYLGGRNPLPNAAMGFLHLFQVGSSTMSHLCYHVRTIKLILYSSQSPTPPHLTPS